MYEHNRRRGESSIATVYTMELLDLLLFISFLLIVIHGVLLFRNWPQRARKLPPGPRGLPIFGSLFQLGNLPHESLASFSKAYGPIISVRLGFVTTVVVSSVDTAKEILQKHDHLFAGRVVPHSSTAEPNYELSVAWLPPGPLWRNLRKILNTQIFSIQRLDALQDIRNRKMSELVRHLQKIASDGKAANIGQLAFGTAFNMLSSTVFSINVVDLRSDGAQEFKDVMAKIMELAGRSNLSDVFPLIRRLDLQGIWRTANRSYERLLVMINEIVDERLRCRDLGSARKKDFLDVLLDYSEEHRPEFDRRQINVLIMDLFIAGTDTTTTTIEWVMAELLRNSDIMGQAQQELLDTIGPGTPVEESDISRLSYLQAVVKETMRLHPIAPLFLPHKATADVEVCGYIIPENTQVLVNSWAISRDASVWEDPTSFKPERFLGCDVDFRDLDLGFIPFGAGRRICPGMPLAVRMVSLMVATLIHSFDWKLPEGMLPQEMDMSEKFGVTLQKMDPVLAFPIIREKKV